MFYSIRWPKILFCTQCLFFKKSNQKIAYFQPLNILDVEVNHKNKGTLEHFKEIKIAHNYQNINTDIVKSSMVLFYRKCWIIVFLRKKKWQPIYLYNYFINVVRHTWFRVKFSSHFSFTVDQIFRFYPQLQETDAAYFEMIDGVFSPFQGTSCLNEHETSLLKKHWT